MDLISLLVVLLIVGIIIWAVQNYAPLDANFKKIIIFVLIVFLIIWVVRALGVNLRI